MSVCISCWWVARSSEVDHGVKGTIWIGTNRELGFVRPLAQCSDSQPGSILFPRRYLAISRTFHGHLGELELCTVAPVVEARDIVEYSALTNRMSRTGQPFTIKNYRPKVSVGPNTAVAP